MSSDTQIRDIFKNQTIFLTGGTGFLGKVLIEKLLRECDDLKRIYILLRPKKGKNLQERYADIFEQPCFEPIKSRNIDVKEKVILVGGDCQEPFLGISTHDLEILKKETNLVIHVAANVKFDQSLKEAALNVRGTRDLVEIAKEMPNLKAFVYVSTAYSNCIQPHIREKVYEPPTQFETLLNLVKTLDEKVLENLTPQLLGKWPNTYVYSKCISEDLVGHASDCFPTAIVRPGIVLNSIEEPLQGWIDNIYGPIGVTLGAGYGVIRSFHARNDAVATIIPVDYTCNCVLAAVWKTAKEKSLTTGVYNYIGFNKKPINWGKYTAIVYSNYWSYGPNKFVWYNTFTLRENKLWHDICTFWLHTIPAYLIDGVLVCLRKPKMAVRGYRKINKVLSLISYFSTKTWVFDDDNVTNLWNELAEDDRKLFKFRADDVEWSDYLRECILGVKRFIVKEPIDNTFGKHAKLATFMVVHYAVVVLFWYLIYKLFAFVFNVFW